MKSRLCKDCRHSYKATLLYRLIEGQSKTWWCYRPGQARSPMDGQIIPTLCEVERKHPF